MASGTGSLRLRHPNQYRYSRRPQGVKSNGGSDLMQLASGRLVGALRNWSAIERAQALTGLKLASWVWGAAGNS